jgi:hypothetical protein
MVQDTPSRHLDKIVVRLPDGLKERIKKAADANKRSVNQELVTTLEAAYPAPDPDDLGKSMFKMLAQLVQVRQEHGYGPGEKERARKAYDQLRELILEADTKSPDKKDFIGAWIELIEAMAGGPIEGLDADEREKLTGKKS